MELGEMMMAVTESQYTQLVMELGEIQDTIDRIKAEMAEHGKDILENEIAIQCLLAGGDNDDVQFFQLYLKQKAKKKATIRKIVDVYLS